MRTLSRALVRMFVTLISVVGLTLGVVAVQAPAYAANRTVTGQVHDAEYPYYVYDQVTVEAFLVSGGGTTPAETTTVGAYQSQYSLSLPEGQYRFRFSSPSSAGTKYVTRWYGDAGQTFATATSVTISGANAQLDATALTHYVNLTGWAYDESNSYYLQNSYAVDAYSITDATTPVATQDVLMTPGYDYNYNGFNLYLPPGRYKLHIRALNDDAGAVKYFSEWHENASDHASAAEVEAGVDQPTVYLAPWGRLTGSVLDEVYGDGVRTPVDIEVYDATQPESAGPVAVQRRRYGWDPSFSVSVPPGSYKIKYVASSDATAPYKTEWSGDAATFATATAVTHDRADTAVDSALLTATYRIAGNLQEDGPYNRRAKNVQVDVFRAGDLSTPLGSASTDSNGDWAVPVAEAGDYKVRYSAPGAYVTEWFNDKQDAATSDDVRVDHDSVWYYCRYHYHWSGPCMDVRPNGWGNSYVRPADLYLVSGRITDNAGDPVPNATVVLHEADDLWTTYGYSDSDGRYQVEARGSGHRYQLQVHSPNGAYAGEWYQDAGSRSRSQKILVEDVDVAGIDVELDSYGEIAGRVTVPDGFDHGSVLVQVRNAETGEMVTTTTPDAQGGYRLGGLPRGRYVVRFESWEPLARTVYDGTQHGAVRDADGREIVIDRAGQIVEGVDHSMVAAAALVVEDPDSRGVHRVRLYAVDDPDVPQVDSHTWCLGAWWYCPGDAQSRILPGTYKVRINEDLWIGGTSFSSATPTVLPGGETTTVQRPVEPATGHVHGRVIDASGAGFAGVRVLFYLDGSSAQTQVAQTDWNGNYHAYHLQVGSYRVKYVDPAGGYATTWYRNADTRESGTEVEVRTNQYGESVNTALDQVRMLRQVVNGTAPTVSGTSRVGETLTADDGGWTPAPVTTTRQWLRDGAPIAGATGATYLLVPEDLGSRISVEVTGARNGYAARVIESERTSAVAPGQLTSTPTPTISGTAKVGKELSASAGAWGPAPVELGYAWFRSGLTEPVGHGTTYTLKAEDRGAKLTVKVTGTKTGYAAVTTTSAATGTIGSGDLTKGTPTISGGPATVGSPLVGSSGTWGPTPVDLAYAWYREGVSGAVGAGEIYTPVADDLGKTLTLKVTGSKNAYTTSTTTSAATAAVVAGTLTAPTPTISGNATFGQRLAAVPGEWGPGAVSLSYQWERNGVAVAGATDQTYLLGTDDIGAQLAVVVTGAKPGYTGQTRTSAATDPVAEATLNDPGTPSVSGSTTVGSTLLATSTGWGPGVVDRSYQWRRDGVDIADATSRSYRLTADDLSKKLTVVVTGTREGYTPRSVTSDPTASIGRGTLTTATPTITGTAAVGNRLRAVVGNWGPAPVDLAYQWVRDSVDVAGATGLSYELTQEDVGTTLKVRVTGTKTGYTTTSKLSSVTAAIAEGTLTAPTPTITGDPVVNKVLTAGPGAWGPGAVDLTYQWSTGSGPIEDATGRHYRVTADDLDKSLTVTVTGSKSGYATTSRASAPTVAVTPAAFGTAPTPTITGVAKFGQRLRAVPGTWQPTPDELRYQWLRDGVAIAGATDPMYDLGLDDIGTRVSVTVTAVRAGFGTASRTSDPTDSVAAGTFTSTPVPTIGGTTTVGEILTATAGTWSPEPVQLAYQWRRAGVDIPAATGPTYELLGRDAGQRITVQVTGSRPGYTSATKTSAATATVAKGTLSATPTPTITGTPKVTFKLTAVPGSWSPDPVTLDYQWSRDGVAIDGAVGKAYVVTAEDVGAKLSVAVTGSKLGYTSVSRGSADTTPVTTVAFPTPPTPTISGTLEVGKVLSAVPGTWNPAPVQLSYRWNRDGVPIPGAIQPDYKLSGDDLGKAMSLTVTGVKPGYNTTARTSAPSDPVAPGTITVTVEPTISGVVQVGQRLVAKPGTWVPGSVALSFQWFRDGTAISGAKGIGYHPTPADVGSRIAVTVFAAKTGYHSTERSTAATEPVAPGTLTKTPTPTITGTAQVGQLLTAQPGDWGPAAISYQWFADGVAITGATLRHYRPTTADQGRRLTVAVTGTRNGYRSETRTSEATAPVT